MEEKKLIDDCFYVKQRKWGTWDSYDTDDKCIVTSLTEEECVRATRFILQGRQEGWDEEQTMVKSENSTVGGKL
jgi:hypothetical protein